MATPIVMPKQGNTVESCAITAWHKRVGDPVVAGEALFTYETDKATFEFESPIAGVLLAIFTNADESAPVLASVGVVGAAGEDWSSLKPATVASVPVPISVQPSAVQQERPAAAQSAPVSVSQPVSNNGAVSPRARSRAQSLGVDASTVSGTGPNGRVIERDILASAANGTVLTRAAAGRILEGGKSAPTIGTGIGGRVRLIDLVDVAPISRQTDEVTEVKLSTIRKIIAQKMMQSLQESAQLTMHASANATNLLAYRKQIKAGGAALGLSDITLTDLISYAVTRTLLAFPDVNSHLNGDVLRRFKHVHLALAVDTPRGLMVPVVRNADALSASDLSAALKDVAAKSVDGSINPDQLTGGTFTISNLGTMGIESFTPVLNPPQVAILGINTITPRPVLKGDGTYGFEPHIGLSLTIDHRALDGAPAARFLKALVNAVENISLTLSL